MNIVIDLKRPIEDLRSELLDNMSKFDAQGYIRGLKNLVKSYEKLKCETIQEEESRTKAIEMIKGIIILYEEAQWYSIIGDCKESIAKDESENGLKKRNDKQSGNINNRIIDKRVEKEWDQVMVIVTTADQNVFVAYSSSFDDPALNEKAALKEIINELNARV